VASLWMIQSPAETSKSCKSLYAVAASELIVAAYAAGISFAT
jgi:hypothetical protein